MLPSQSEEGTLFQRDYIMRAIEQAAQAIARAFGFIVARKFDDAERELAAGYAAIGLDRELIGVLDAASFARQLRDDERIEGAVRLLACDAQLCAQRGDATRGRARLRLARGLLEHLTNPTPGLREEVEAAAAALENGRAQAT
jgi:hypothetical protein